MKLTLYFQAALLLFIAGPVLADESIESLEKKVGEVAAKVKSMTCKERTLLDSDMGGGNSLRQEANATLEFRREAGKVQWRSEETSTQVQRLGKNESKQVFERITFDDGECSWMVLTNAGKTTYYKMKMRSEMMLAADKAFFDQLKADHELKVLPDAMIDDKKCAVIEALPKMFKGKLEPGQGVTQYFIRQDIGLIVKKIINDTKGKPMTTMTRSEIKVDPTLGADRFAPPAGATVVDMK